jgi:2-methylisocitrate lyase-like PEP mutase family enzyme
MNLMNSLEAAPARMLRGMLNNKSALRFMEAHNGLSTLIACMAQSSTCDRAFDGIWVSSLTCTASVGLPDVEMPGIDRRLSIIEQIAQQSNKPILVDGDTGGSLSTVRFFCRSLMRAGVGGVVFEEKAGEKRNSLDAKDQNLADPVEFATKIRAARDMIGDGDLMVIARLEGYNAGLTLEQTMQRARRYVEAGVEGIFVHSKSRESTQVLEFAQVFRGEGYTQPIICVPTTFYATTANQLFEGGVNGVIYANQQLRAAAAAMTELCRSVLDRDGVFEIENAIMPTKQVFDIVGYTQEIKRIGELTAGNATTEA